MPRYIDADALKAHIMEFACDPCKKYGSDRDGIRCPFCNTGNLLGEIDEAPTADVMEVVRCADCEYYTAEDRWCRRLGLCGAFDGDGYCCYGERREDVEDIPMEYFENGGI